MCGSVPFGTDLTKSKISEQQEEPNRLSVTYYGEFDPGSGRTLAACLTHASRTGILFRQNPSGERVSNA